MSGRTEGFVINDSDTAKTFVCIEIRIRLFCDELRLLAKVTVTGARRGEARFLGSTNQFITDRTTKSAVAGLRLQVRCPMQEGSPYEKYGTAWLNGGDGTRVRTLNGTRRRRIPTGEVVLCGQRG